MIKGQNVTPTSSYLSKRDLSTLVETGRDLAEKVTLKALLQQILDKATELTDSQAGSVILVHRKRGILYFAHATGPDCRTVLERWGENSNQGVPIDSSMAGEVFKTGQSKIVNAVRDDPKHFQSVDHDTGSPTDSMACVPMTVAGKRIGVVQILNKRKGHFSNRDLVLIEHFAAQAAVAIRNARLIDGLLAHVGLYASRDTDDGPLEFVDELAGPAHNEVLSVLFADMRGFTQLCHVERSPERTQQLLNEFLGMLADVVTSQGGLVNKFLGDGLMALFRGRNHAIRAVKSADEMLKRFVRLRAGWDEVSNNRLSFLDLGIGITTDNVIIGSIGSATVRDFTAVGTAVNLASNLMEQARNGRRLIIDKLTYREAKEVIDEFEGPEPFELKKPGQTVGHPYERYIVKSLKSDSKSKPVHTESSASNDSAHRQVFICYSHKDNEWLAKILVHLKPYVRGGGLKTWSDVDIRPGDQWLNEIKKALETSSVALLLVSPHFLDSEFITANELPPLLAASESRGLRILWIPISSSSYDETEIARYQSVIDPTRPLDSLTPAEQNRTLVDICKAIKAATVK